MDGTKEECVGERKVSGTREERGGRVRGRREERGRCVEEMGNMMYAVHLWSFTCTSEPTLKTLK
jgi:hypothetical protein